MASELEFFLFSQSFEELREEAGYRAPRNRCP